MAYWNSVPLSKNIRQDYRIDLIMKKRIKVNPGDGFSIQTPFKWFNDQKSNQLVISMRKNLGLRRCSRSEYNSP